MYKSDIKKQVISIEGKIYIPHEFHNKKIPIFALHSEFHKELFLFLKEWFSHSPFLIVKTSGSTGLPKEMMVEKERMMRSAEMTCSFLRLKEGDKSLLCMPLDYISGKMMVVRALVAGLDLYPVAPSGNPLKNTQVSFEFAAMIPMQVYNSLQAVREKKQLKKIKTLIIGGGFIDPLLENELKTLPNKIYSTYGMTETLSHVAMRRLNGNQASEYYTPFPSVNLSLCEDNTLIIDAPLIANERLFTNDIVHINNDGSFFILGRKDNIINSGGIKIQAEEIEKQLKPIVKGMLAITSMPDEKFGEIVILVVEDDLDEVDLNKISPVYYRPKRIIKIDKIPQTETGKIKRKTLKKMIESKSNIFRIKS